MNFNLLVSEIVGPTLNDYGFSLLNEINNIMTFKRANIRIKMSYDAHSSYEVSMSMSFQPGNEFYTYDELRAYFFNERSDFATQLVEEEGVRKWLHALNVFFDEKLDYILNNEHLVQNALSAIRLKRVTLYNLRKKQIALKEEVDLLWMNKDYQGLVQLLKEEHTEMEESIKLKYQYALKKMSS